MYREKDPTARNDWFGDKAFAEMQRAFSSDATYKEAVKLVEHGFTLPQAIDFVVLRYRQQMTRTLRLSNVPKKGN